MSTIWVSQTEAILLAELWNIAKHFELDSDDDQEAIELGWRHGLRLIGAPKIDREGSLYKEFPKLSKYFIFD